jgi:hypothetical protein
VVKVTILDPGKGYGCARIIGVGVDDLIPLEERIFVFQIFKVFFNGMKGVLGIFFGRHEIVNLFANIIYFIFDCGWGEAYHNSFTSWSLILQYFAINCIASRDTRLTISDGV